MKAILIVYSPGKMTWDNLEKVADESKKGIKYKEGWECAYKHVNLGDRIFLIQLGNKKRGIFAAGHCVKEGYMTENIKGKTSNHIDVEFDWVQNPNDEKILDVLTLEREISSQDWHPQRIRKNYW